MYSTVRKDAKEKKEKNEAKKLPKTWRFLHRIKLSNRIDRKKRRVAKLVRINARLRSALGVFLGCVARYEKRRVAGVVVYQCACSKSPRLVLRCFV